MLLFAALTTLFATASAKDGRTFAVLRFYGDGPLTEARVDPIVNPGEVATHVHSIMGGSAFHKSVTGEELRKSDCTNTLIAEDKSAYWTPKLYFHDKANNTFEPVPMFYQNVYYFFEGTNDEIEAFPVGLSMLSGETMRRTSPGTDGTLVLDPAEGTIQPAQWTCPRSGFDPPSWPADSDGSEAGQQDPNNKGSGTGFPFAECDGYASPLRMDLHFPSCYNPKAGLTNYKENMKFPTDNGNGKQDCPEGWIHTPHLFFEVYWNTPLFKDRWTPNQGEQPFVLSSGDVTGYSAHGDFISGWDEHTLKTIIDTCNAGDAGMDKCPDIPGGLTDTSSSCNIPSEVDEDIYGSLSSLPGNNPLAGWGIGSYSADGNDHTNENDHSNNSDDTETTSSISAPRPSSTQVTSAATEAADAGSTGNAHQSPSGLLGGKAPTAHTTFAKVKATASSQPDETQPLTRTTKAPLRPNVGGGHGGQHGEDGNVAHETVYNVVTDLETVYATVTVTDTPAVAEPTVDGQVIAKRGSHNHVHDHMLRHRSKPMAHKHFGH